MLKKWDHDKKTHESTLLQEASVNVFAILAKNVWEENFRRLFSYFYVKHSKAPTLSRHCGTTISPGIIFWTNTNVNLTWKCVHTIFSNFNERVSKMRSFLVYALSLCEHSIHIVNILELFLPSTQVLNFLIRRFFLFIFYSFLREKLNPMVAPILPFATLIYTT